METNMVLNLSHLITAVRFAATSKERIHISIQFMQIIGTVYILINLIVFTCVTIVMDTRWDDIIYLHLLSYLQFGIGVTISAFGALLKKRILLVNA